LRSRSSNVAGKSWLGRETSTGATSASPYRGMTAERRNALFHDYQMTFYGVSE
jgi:hypothetical protein